MEQYIKKVPLVAEIEDLKSAAEVMLTGKTDLSYWRAQKDLSERLLSLINKSEVEDMVNTTDDGDLESIAEKYAYEKYPSIGVANTEIYNAVKFGGNWQKTRDELVPEDLGEYINELSKQFPEVSFAKLSRIVVRAVKWKEKRQSIENTIDAVVLKNYDGKVLVYDEADIDEKLSDYKVGDEVKLAIIKGNE